ncbi:MAG: 5-formyltetrahydrofolate cyclo-ligase [Bdellovibrionaceae bacterium]|jgi:5-formyltetrahydrofolate cyclo-ligase|nr:5-formyltetrahydrofolate cyclo-ligase [Pseudobdellovibrionaceae bacterium]
MLAQKSKAELRERYKVMRRELFESLDMDQITEAIAQNLDVGLSKNIINIGSYMPILGEPDPNGLRNFRPDLQWSYPVVVGESLEFYKVPNYQRDFKPGAFGIPEPKADDSKRISINDLDCILVPGVAFDRSANRLGQGRGFYDRALKDFKGLKVGVAYTPQILNEDLPCEDHDLSMDLIVCEDYIFGPAKGHERNLQ